MSRIIPITVLMTVYNGQAYLKKAIESVLAQTFIDFEFLIIDDCSKDGSVDIIRSFADARIVLHQNTVNLGQTKSLNLGLRLAQGEFIARMDADDFAFQSWLEELLRFLRAQENQVALVSPQAIIVDETDRVHKTLNTPQSFNEIIIRSLWASPVNHVGVLMRRQTVLDHGGYDERFRIAADYALWSTLLRNGLVLNVLDRPLVAVRSHANSITAMAAGKGDVPEVSSIMRENIKYWAKDNLNEEDVQLLWHLIYNVKELTLNQLIAGLKIFDEVRKGFLTRKHCSLEFADRCFRNQVSIICMKRIFDCILNRDIVQLRKVSAIYRKAYGNWNVFLLIQFCSYVQGALFLCPVIYNYYRKLNTFRRGA